MSISDVCVANIQLFTDLKTNKVLICSWQMSKSDVFYWLMDKPSYNFCHEVSYNVDVAISLQYGLQDVWQVSVVYHLE